MASAWGTAWGDAWGDSWGADDGTAPPPVQSTGPGWQAYVREAKRRGRNRPIPQDEELVHPEQPESIRAGDAGPKEVLSAEKVAQLLTRGLRQPIVQAPEHDDEEDIELLLLTI